MRALLASVRRPHGKCLTVKILCSVHTVQSHKLAIVLDKKQSAENIKMGTNRPRLVSSSISVYNVQPIH